MKKTQEIVCLFGRIFISLFFILSALNKVFEWQKAEMSFSSSLSDLHSFCGFSLGLQGFFSFMLEWSALFLGILTVIELLGGLLIFFGIKPRFGAVLLIVFMFFTTILLHHFWFLEGIKRELQLISFLKNIAITGGLLYILAMGVKPKEDVIRLSSFSSAPKPSPESDKNSDQ